AYVRSAMLRDYGLLQLVRFLIDLQFGVLMGSDAAAPRGLLAEVSPGRSIEAVKSQIADAFVAESEAGLAISRSLLQWLTRHLKIGVVSNFYGNLDRVLAEAGLARSIAMIADSGRLGLYKPDPRIFRASLAQLGVLPHEAVMVGDSLTKDCMSAQAMGMVAVW